MIFFTSILVEYKKSSSLCSTLLLHRFLKWFTNTDPLFRVSKKLKFSTISFKDWRLIVFLKTLGTNCTIYTHLYMYIVYTRILVHVSMLFQVWNDRHPTSTSLEFRTHRIWILTGSSISGGFLIHQSAGAPHPVQKRALMYTAAASWAP